MIFKKAKIETTGCSDYSVCPAGHARCCLFCNEPCDKRCDMAKIYDKQPRSWQENFDCPKLKPINELAWKLILGPDLEVGK